MVAVDEAVGDARYMASTAGCCGVVDANPLGTANEMPAAGTETG